VRTQTRTTGGVGLSQSRTTATGGGRLENGHLHFFTSGVEVGSDGGEVGDGSGHVSDVFDSYKIQEFGGQVKRLNQSPNCPQFPSIQALVQKRPPGKGDEVRGRPSCR